MTNPIGTNHHQLQAHGGPSLRSLLGVGETLLGSAAKTFGATSSFGGAATALSTLAGDGGTIDIAELLMEQTRIQQETQAITLQSNVSHTEHEARMSVVRNTKS